MEPKTAHIKYTGPMMVYFNAHNTAPLMWCVAMNNAEIAVRDITIFGCNITTRYEKRERKPDHSGPPSAWMELVGTLTVTEDGSAVIRCG